MKTKFILMKSGVALAALSLVNAPALAQNDEGSAALTKSKSDQTGVPEIIVTATRRASLIQDVPAAITAFNDQQIEEQGIKDIADFAAVTPGITVAQGFFGGDKPIIVFRGLGTLAGAAASVGVLVDGVNLPAGEPLRNRMFDLERIEVVKGPQAALYGRDTIGGVINVITKQPTNDLEGRVYAGLGSGNTYEFNGAISGAFVPDVLRARVSGAYLKSDGFFNNYGGYNQDVRDEKSVRGQLQWLISPDVDATLYMGYLDLNDGYNAAFFTTGLNDQKTIEDNGDVLDAENPGFNKRTNWDTSLKLRANFGAAELTSITQFQRIHTKLDLDADFGLIRLGAIAIPGVTGITQLSDLKTRDFSEDLRLVSASDKPFRWITGFFYAQQKRDLELNSIIHIGSIAVPGPSAANFKDTNWSIYGQLEYDLMSNLTVSGALRYSEDKHRHSRVANPLKEDVYTPQFVIKYKIIPDVMFYGSYTEGYRSGGYDINTGNAYKSERTKNWEGGIKSSWLNRRLTANASAYWITYSNQQITTIVTLPSGALVGGTANVGDTKLRGVEFELNAVPVSKFVITAGASFSHARVKTGTPAFVGHPLPYNIPFKGTFSAQYTFDIGDKSSFVPRVEWTYVDSQYWGTTVVGGQRHVLEQNAYSLINLRGVLNAGNLSLAAEVQNLFDKQFNDEIFPDIVPGYHAAYPGLPRRYTISASYKF